MWNQPLTRGGKGGWLNGNGSRPMRYQRSRQFVVSVCRIVANKRDTRLRTSRGTTGCHSAPLRRVYGYWIKAHDSSQRGSWPRVAARAWGVRPPGEKQKTGPRSALIYRYRYLGTDHRQSSVEVRSTCPNFPCSCATQGAIITTTAASVVSDQARAGRSRRSQKLVLVTTKHI